MGQRGYATVRSMRTDIPDGLNPSELSFSPSLVILRLSPPCSRSSADRPGKYGVDGDTRAIALPRFGRCARDGVLSGIELKEGDEDSQKDISLEQRRKGEHLM